MGTNKLSSRAWFAVTILTLAYAGGWYEEHLANQRTALASAQTANEGADLGGYRILKRLRAPYAPLGGGRSPFPKLVIEDNQRRFWIAFHRGGHVQLYDEPTGQWELFFDRGADTLKSREQRIHHHRDALLPGDISYICQGKDGVMWFSADHTSPTTLSARNDKLLTSFDGKQWRSFPIDATQDGRIGLFQGKDGRVWFWAIDEFKYWDRGRWSESIRVSDVSKKSERRFTPTTPSEEQIQRRGRNRYEILAGMQDSQGYLWFSTYSGIITYHPQDGKLREHPELKDARASSIYEDRHGRIWVNDDFGAVMYDTSSRALIRFNPLPHIDGQPNVPDETSLINGIYQDRRGRMIFVYLEGLVTLNETENRWSFVATKKLGLDAEETHNDLNGIMEDSQGRIWLPGFTGIAILEQPGFPPSLQNPTRNFRRPRVR